MTNSTRNAIYAGLVVLGIATVALFAQNQKQAADFKALKASDEATRNRYAQTIDAVAEIQDSLNAISLGDTNVRMLTQDAAERRLSGPDQADALERIATLRSTIMRSRDRIHQLESSLKSSGIKTASLNRMIANLKTTLNEKEAMVFQLAGEVDSLTTVSTQLATEVQAKSDTIQVKDSVIEQKRSQVATVFYIVGDKKTLTQQGVLVAKGGVLGMGKTLTPGPNPNETLFTTLDTDKETVITLPTAKAQVVSAQPVDSYALVPGADGHLELHITNAVEFRKVKNLVIVTRA